MLAQGEKLGLRLCPERCVLFTEVGYILFALHVTALSMPWLSVKASQHHICSGIFCLAVHHHSGRNDLALRLCNLPRGCCSGHIAVSLEDARVAPTG